MNQTPVRRADLERVSSAGARAVAYGYNRVLCRVLDRFKVFVDSRDEMVGPHLALDGYWEPWVTTAVLNNVARTPRARCVNVGAHVGYYTLVLGQLSVRVDAFEPNPHLFELLRANVSVNGFDGVVRLWRGAVTDSVGTVELVFTHERSANGRARRDSDLSGSGWVREVVKTTTLDSALLDDPQPVDFLLCDSEGSEPLVIAGAAKLLSEHSPRAELLLEWSPQRYVDKLSAAAVLLDHKFKPYEVGLQGELIPRDADWLLQLSRETMVWFKRAA